MVLQAVGEISRIQTIAKGGLIDSLPFTCLEHAIGCDKIALEVQSKILALLDCLSRLNKADLIVGEKRESLDTDRKMAMSIRSEIKGLVKASGSMITRGILEGFQNNHLCINPKNVCDFCCYRVQSEKVKVIGTITFGSDTWTQVDVEKLHLPGEYQFSRNTV